MSTALSSIGMLVNPGGVLGFVFAALAAVTGAVSIAKIASAKIPEYAMGTDNHPGGWSIWGEKQAEVAIDPMKGLMFAENPTLEKFNPGAKIFKSVEEFEKNISLTKGGDKFEIDYEKMGTSIASKMPRDVIELNNNGSFTLQKKNGDRLTAINNKWAIAK